MICMNPKEIIPIQRMDLYDQKMHEGTELRLELYDCYFKYIGIFHAEEPKDKEDHSLGWETVYNNFEISVIKTSMVSIVKSWNDKYKYYCLYISVNGMGEDISLFFKKEKDVDIVKQKLITYFYD